MAKIKPTNIKEVIVKSSNICLSMWYSDKIGERFEVDKTDKTKDYYQLKDSNKIVFKKDCLIKTTFRTKEQYLKLKNQQNDKRTIST